MKIFLAHFRLHFFTLFRQPSYVVSTLIFPSLFFLFFALPNADDARKADFLMASFSAFAVLGVVFLDFSVTTSRQKDRPWSNYLRTLSVSFSVSFLARAAAALVYAIGAAAMVFLTVTVFTPAEADFSKYFTMTWVLIFGAIPFALMALALGQWTPAESALPITNLFYLSFSFAGGLWLPPNALPSQISWLSENVPTRWYGEILWSQMFDTEVKAKWVVGLFLCGILGYLVAVAGAFRQSQKSIRLFSSNGPKT